MTTICFDANLYLFSVGRKSRVRLFGKWVVFHVPWNVTTADSDVAPRDDVGELLVISNFTGGLIV